MTIQEIKAALQQLADAFSKDIFIYDLLTAYGISKTSITRLKNGDFNLSKVPGEVLYKGKVFYKAAKTAQLLTTIEDAAKDERILKGKPRFIISTDGKTIAARDMKTRRNADFKIAELSKYAEFFQPLTGAEAYRHRNDNKADREAAYQLGKLYDILVTDNPDYTSDSHQLNLFLSRLLFCFFAEDTDIFKEGIFTKTLVDYTDERGTDIHTFLNALFERLSIDRKDFPEHLQAFPYVNGGLFRDAIAAPKFSRKSRDILIECGELDWADINPDIFGSMIQAVADPQERSHLGMHYTSVENILKLIGPLFLDALKAEAEKWADNPAALKKLIARIGSIKFFDPACGSGNFLIITYKELRLLEIRIIQRLIELEKQASLHFTAISLSQFYGIEIKDFPHEMALLSLWLAEHQMNKVFDDKLEGWGQSKPILPLKEAGHITRGNAARIAWEDTCPKGADDEIYVLGNPPYLGSNMHSDEQRIEMRLVFNEDNLDRLDYIGTWFILAAQYIKGTSHKAAFVTTNSITQGVQVPFLWRRILDKGIFIHFAVKSFKWTNSARGNAGVSVAIIGLSSAKTSKILLYDKNVAEPVESISPYLIKNVNSIVLPASKPLNTMPPLVMGNKPADDGNLILNEREANELVAAYPRSKKFIKKFISADDFINGNIRFCLWIEPKYELEAKAIPPIKERTEKLRAFRAKSKAESTRDFASNDFQFRQVCYKPTDGIVVPRVSSERRDYIPLAYVDDETIVSDATNIVYDAQPWLFGVLHSKMHMVWVDAVGGKLETRYRYSAKLVYNTFPFPDITAKQKETIAQYVYAVLDERAKYPQKTMAWLYNPDTMPAGLRQAHRELDEAIEAIYRQGNPFSSDAERLEHLFKRYEEMMARDTIFAKAKKMRKTKAKPTK